MGNYEKGDPSVDREEKQKKASGLKTKEGNNKTRSRLHSFLNTDTNKATNEYYNKVEKKNQTLLVKNDDGKREKISIQNFKRRKNLK